MSRRLSLCLFACLVPVSLFLILVLLPAGSALASRAGLEAAAPFARPGQIEATQAITPIGVARGLPMGTLVTIEGNVTVPPDVFNAASAGYDYLMIQDATGGMYIYRQSGGPPASGIELGDVVQITGTVGMFQANVQVGSLTGLTRIGSGTPPAPLPISTTNTVLTATQGLLVQVEGIATWSSAPPVPGASNWSFSISDGSGAITVFVDRDTFIDMRGYTSGSYMRLVGFSGAYNATPEVMIRFQSDIWTPGPPAVLSTVPTDGATGVLPNTTVQATFNTPMDAGTINTTTFLLEGPGGAVAGAVDYVASAQAAVFTPTANLAYTTRYTATLTTAIHDIYGTPLASAYTWSFTTSDSTTPIAVARAAGPGWSGAIRGNVTVPPGVYGNAYMAIQDVTGGMYIYKSSGLPTVQLGDDMIITGTITSLYHGLMELIPSATQVMGPGTVPAPLVVATGAVTGTQGLLVQVEGTFTGYVTGRVCTVPPMGTDCSFWFNDGSGGVQIFIDKDTRINAADLAAGMPLRIVGFSGNYDRAQVMPRYQTDLMDLQPPSVTGTNPANNATGVDLYHPLYATFSKLMEPATIDTSTFLLEGPGGPIVGSVAYVGSNRTASFTPASLLSAQTRYTATLTTGIEDIFGIPLPAPYVWSFTTGDADITAPTILARAPGIGATGVLFNARVVITFSEELRPETVIASNFTLLGPAGPIPWDGLTYDPVMSKLELDPPSFAPLTVYTATVGAGVTDWAGNPVAGTLTWSFTTQAEPTMQAYFGDIHNHTSYSDGSGSPDQALATGQAAGYDFMALSDHSYAIDDGEWAQTLTAVNAATTGSFVALRGFEYTQGAEGHINVFNTVRHAVRTNVPGCTYCDYTPNLEAGVTVQGFYPWLAITGTQALDGDGTVMQFNHPGWINFNDWTYHPEVGATARLEEVGNGNGSSYVFSEDEYIRSLDYGWKVGATNNADTHTTYWGTNTDSRTGVWMPGLTRADLLEALRARRTFATEDKNYALGMRANNYWMGSEFPNTGAIAFTVTGSDPDGELGGLAQLITYGGEVVTQTTFSTATWTWQPVINITPGAHYYYVKVTQPDGDRIVTTPVWTTSGADVRITDLQIEPTIATIFNPSLITARISNRGTATATLTATFQVDGSPIGTMPVVVGPCTLGPCSDGYAFITWQPVITGTVTVAASFTGAPAGDNPDDNHAEASLNVTDERVPLVLIDAGHNNIGSQPRDARLFAEDLTEHGYNVLFNLDAITASDLNTETVKLLILNAWGPSQLTSAEMDAVTDFVAAGGSIWLNGMSDYTGKVPWANTVSNRMNGLIAAIETRTGAQIPILFNDDEVLDGNTNNGYIFGVQWWNFPMSVTTGIGMNVVQAQSWSDVSLTDRNRQALTQSDLGPNGYLTVIGDLDEGSTGGTPNRTHNEDNDGEGDAYIYQPGEAVAAGAGWDIPGAAGRLYFYCDANDPFNVFSYTSGDGKQNEALNLETVMWLLGQPLQQMTVAEARADAELNNTPDRLDELVWVEGWISTAYGEFFNSMVIQDGTGGITIHAPAGDISASTYARGKYVRAVGTIGIYQGDTEIEFFEAEQVQVISTTVSVPVPILMTTHDAGLESNQGWLVQVTGRVTGIIDDYAVLVDDGSGPVRVFIDGYNGNFTAAQVGDRALVVGISSEDGDGPRIRVRQQSEAVFTPAPIVTLAPDALAVVVLQNAQHTEVLTLGNSGTLTLTWTLSDLYARSWLSFAPAAGNLAPQASADIEVYFNTAGLAAGSYTTTLRLAGNDPDTPALDIPVALTVVPYKIYTPVIARNMP